MNHQAFVPAQGYFCTSGRAIAVTMRPDQAHSRGLFEVQLRQRMPDGSERLVASGELSGPVTAWHRRQPSFRTVLRPGRIRGAAPAAAPPINGSLCRVVIMRIDGRDEHGFSGVIEVEPA
ncbi:hypothetical protein [Caldimonas mangrovi]|uniref:hypothetical protein n=1 Tax=Caldimonas mangrovi TaxID=2944811 RepID=UPI002042D150|nr:hypothetical protein [Caldimonas mangrovi]